MPDLYKKRIFIFLFLIIMASFQVMGDWVVADLPFDMISNATCSHGYVLQNVTINETGLSGYCVNITSIEGYISDTNCSTDQSCDTVLYNSDLPLANKTSIHCTNITGGSDGDFCTDATGSGGDGTGGWTNTSSTTSTDLDVNISGNTTVGTHISTHESNSSIYFDPDGNIILILAQGVASETVSLHWNTTTGNHLEDLSIWSVSSSYYGIYSKWDISSIPSGATITDAIFCIYIDTGGLTDTDANLSRINNQTWTEANPGIVQPLDNITSSNAWTNATAIGWGCIDVLDIINVDHALGNKNSSFRIADDDYNFLETNFQDGGGLVIGNTLSDYLGAAEREISSPAQPYINITYTTAESSLCKKLFVRNMTRGADVFSVDCNGIVNITQLCDSTGCYTISEFITTDTNESTRMSNIRGYVCPEGQYVRSFYDNSTPSCYTPPDTDTWNSTSDFFGGLEDQGICYYEEGEGEVICELGQDTFVNTAGDTMTGDLYLPSLIATDNVTAVTVYAYNITSRYTNKSAIKFHQDGSVQVIVDPITIEQKQQQVYITDKATVQLGQFGGVTIEQLEVDEDFPCYLQSDGKVFCNAISISALNKYILDGKDMTKGIPVTDYRKPIYSIVEHKCDPKDKKCIPYNETVFEGYEKHYIDYLQQNILNLGNKKGLVHIGFSSNVYNITDFNYGYGNNVSIEADTVELSNSYLDCSDSDIVLCMDFKDDNSTTAIDKSGYDNHGTLTVATHTHERYDFDGDSDYITTGNKQSLDRTNTNFTYIAWVYFDDNSRSWILSLGFDYSNNLGSGFEKLDNGSLRIWFGKASFNSNTAPNLNQWYHVAVSFNGTGGIFYLNGNPDGTYVHSTINTSGNGDYIGAQSTSHSEQFFNGSIDEVLIYNRSLSSAEITALYNKGLFRHYGNYTSPILTPNPAQSTNWTQLVINMTEPGASNITFKTRGINISKINLTHPNLVSYWSLNQSNGCDDTVGSNDGTPTGTTCGNVAGFRPGENATSFDGDNDNIALGNNLFNISESFTISLWAYNNEDCENGNDMFTILDADHGFSQQLEIQARYKDFVVVWRNKTNNDFYPTARDIFLESRWRHFVLAFDTTNNNVTAYLDGILEHDEIIGQLTFNESFRFDIGTMRGDINDFNGSIAEVAIFNTSLTQDEIIEIGTWSACSLDVTHTLCDIATNPTNSLQWMAEFRTKQPPNNYTSVLNQVNVTYFIPEPITTEAQYYITDKDENTLFAVDLQDSDVHIYGNLIWHTDTYNWTCSINESGSINCV